MSEFSKQVPLSNQAFDLLPLFHTCDAYTARNHIRSGAIDTPEVCDVFNKPITYLFYGRPAFKYKVPNSSRQLSLYPVAFMIQTDAIETVEGIYPFDTGAMQLDKYKAYLHEKMTILDFALEPTTNRIADIIIQFFESNENYIKGKTIEINADPSHFESAALAELYRSLIQVDLADERRATIEVQAGQTVSLGNGSLKGLIVPTGLRDDPLFKNFANSTSAAVESYDAAVTNPENCFGLIQAAANTLMKKLGMIK